MQDFYLEQSVFRLQYYYFYLSNRSECFFHHCTLCCCTVISHGIKCFILSYSSQEIWHISFNFKHTGNISTNAFTDQFSLSPSQTSPSHLFPQRESLEMLKEDGGEIRTPPELIPRHTKQRDLSYDCSISSRQHHNVVPLSLC